jgi:hypothetical protein
MHSYETLSEALKGLNERGYTHDFNIKTDSIECSDIDLELKPEDFEIDEVYRFEGNSNPDDEEVVYAIRSKDGVKGVMVDAFGPYAVDISAELIKKLKYAHK